MYCCAHVKLHIMVVVVKYRIVLDHRDQVLSNFQFSELFFVIFCFLFFFGVFLFLAPRTIPECSAVVSERVERRYSPRIRQVVERLPCAEATHPSRGLMSNTHATSGSSQAAKLRFGQFICGCPPWPMAACTDVLLLLWCAAFISFRPQVVPVFFLQIFVNALCIQQTIKQSRSCVLAFVVATCAVTATTAHTRTW